MVDSERTGGTLAPATVSTMGAPAAARLADLDLVAVFEEAFEEAFEDDFEVGFEDDFEEAAAGLVGALVEAFAAGLVEAFAFDALVPASATFGSRDGVAAFRVFAAPFAPPFPEAPFAEPPLVVLAGAVRRAEGTFAIDRTVYRNRGPGSNGSL
jgi:hypothetical protein